MKNLYSMLRQEIRSTVQTHIDFVTKTLKLVKGESVSNGQNVPWQFVNVVV